MTIIYDRGELILFEMEFKKKILHVDSYNYFDPSSATITITAPNSTVVVTTATLNKSNVNSAGLYNYVCPSSTGWITGLYETKVVAYDSNLMDTIVYERNFELE